jgi:UDP:flavonoid glycosyltransferase YjiC (YdhE family)
VVWWSTPTEPRFSTAVDALAGVQALASVIAARSDVRAVISLGGTELPADVVDRMGHANVRVERYVDQWQVLRDADVFVTHHGLNSTHESIANLTPMLSYPFIWDQPGLAARCQELGVARALAPSLRAPLDETIVHAALDTFQRERDDLAAAVDRARQWELDTVDGRPAVIDALLDLMR